MPPARDPLLESELAASPARRLVSLAAGAGVSFLILFALVQAQRTKLVETEAPFEELRAVVLIPPPPPPPRERTEEAPAPPALLNLEPAPAEETVPVAFAPETLLTPSQPAAEPHFEFALDDFRPQSREVTLQRQAYRVREVDEPPIPIYKKVPRINPEILDKVDIVRTIVMYMVDLDGTVHSVYLLGSGQPQFDQLVIDAAEKWRFKPAIKDGRPVRCWIRHRITVQESAGSSNPFHVN